MRFFVFFVAVCLIGGIGQTTVSANVGDDTLRTAKSIKNSGSVTGVLIDGSDRDFYVFKAPKNGLFTIKMSNGGKTKTVTILDEKGETVFSELSTDNNQLGNASRSVGLKKGQKVFVKIHRYSGYDVAYKLNYAFKAGNNYEKENNDTIRKANVIAATSKVTGELQGGSDIDYFKFTLKAAGNVNLKMSNAGQSKSIHLLNSKQEELVTMQTNDNVIGNATRNIGLAKGTYYIKIDRYSGYYVPYVLNLKYTKSNYYEKEINNTLRTANLINLNKTYAGVLEGGSDIDYFKFKVTKKKSVKIYLDNTGDYKNLYLLNSTGTSLGSFSTNPALKGNSTLKVMLKKGTYYVQIARYSGYNQPYKLKVK